MDVEELLGKLVLLELLKYTEVGPSKNSPKQLRRPCDWTVFIISLNLDKFALKKGERKECGATHLTTGSNILLHHQETTRLQTLKEEYSVERKQPNKSDHLYTSDKESLQMFISQMPQNPLNSHKYSFTVSHAKPTWHHMTSYVSGTKSKFWRPEQ